MLFRSFKNLIMRFFYIIVVTFLLFLSSCGGEKNEYYGKTIPRDTFVVILAELQIADAMNAMYALNQQGVNINQGLVYQDVLRRHKCDREGFEMTMDYYTGHKEEFEKIYLSVAEYLDEMSARYSSGDSLKIQNINP